ncbi:MAG TPA: hypothetical protein VI564_09145 [Candidatus Nanoarchaeia archaeon]|nr:hypothetical protein [Candidatus Nanoarchaeia archaeon]
MSGHGLFEFYKHYMEFFFMIFLVLGAILALLARSAVVSYVIIFLCGMFAGRILFFRRSNIKLPYYVITLGFGIGYILVVQYGSRLITGIFFISGAIICYKLFEKKVLKDVLY